MEEEAARPVQYIKNILVIIAIVGVIILIYVERDWITRLGDFNYLGIFLIGLVASAAMFAPVPGLAILATAAPTLHLNPFLAGLLFAIGAAIGELSGYVAGVAGHVVIKRSKWYDRMERWMKKYGGVTILILGFIPNPLIDVAGMVAGALKMHWYTFLFWCFLGKLPKCLLVSYGGLALFKFLQ